MRNRIGFFFVGFSEGRGVGGVGVAESPLVTRGGRKCRESGRFLEFCQ